MNDLEKKKQAATDAEQDYLNTNYGDFKQGEEYKQLENQTRYQGEQAMKDTMGQASARTGGYANSYAIHAGQQAQNSYMANLENAARALYDNQKQEKLEKMEVANAIYDRAYNEKQDADNKAKQELADYENDLYTDFSLMSDEELAKVDWNTYASNAAALGMDQSGFERIKKLVTSDKAAAASEAASEAATTAETELLEELANGGVFNPFDPRIAQSGKDVNYFYNSWKNAWKDNALDQDTVNNNIEKGMLSPNTLMSYEVYYGDSYCKQQIEDIVSYMSNTPRNDDRAAQWTDDSDADFGEQYEQIESYMEMWYSYDPEGANRYITSLAKTDPDHPILKKLPSSTYQENSTYHGPKGTIKDRYMTQR